MASYSSRPATAFQESSMSLKNLKKLALVNTSHLSTILEGRDDTKEEKLVSHTQDLRRNSEGRSVTFAPHPETKKNVSEQLHSSLALGRSSMPTSVLRKFPESTTNSKT